MSDGSLINLGELSKPATVLIEKISDAIGGIFRPLQICRVAQAEADAEKIKEVAKIEISELQKRALNRFFQEEVKKQNNIENITRKAIPDVNTDAKPENIEDDWITNFFEKCRLISDDEIQTLWSKVLAGEANKPGQYSKRTVNFLSELDKSDALLFTKLCSYGWYFGNVIPLIYDIDHDIYNKKGIDLSALTHLDNIGLLRFEAISGFARNNLPKDITIFYYGTPINIRFAKDKDNQLALGHVTLSKVGEELFPICGSNPYPEFVDYVLNQWIKKGYQVYSPMSETSSKMCDMCGKRYKDSIGGKTCEKGHFICLSCISTLTQCPLCKKPIAEN